MSKPPRRAGVSKPLHKAGVSPARALSAALTCGLLLIRLGVPAQAGAMNTSHTLTQAARAVKLAVSFSPERLGAGTTVSLGFQISTPSGQAPSPLIAIELLYPGNLGIATSSLGLETCLPASLEQNGLAGCPADSLMGRGSAAVAVPFGPRILIEQASITLLSGPVQNGHLGLLFFASGEIPVLANLVFPGLVLPAHAPFGGLLDATLPLVPSVPGGPDASVVRLQTTIGPSHITYYERVNGKTIAFHPKGILLPKSCPRGGFPFTAHLSFQDATHASASTTVPCPRGS